MTIATTITTEDATIAEGVFRPRGRRALKVTNSLRKLVIGPGGECLIARAFPFWNPGLLFRRNAPILLRIAVRKDGGIFQRRRAKRLLEEKEFVSRQLVPGHCAAMTALSLVKF
jgi:hypothetical protein